MKWALPLFLIFNISAAFAENTIIAIANNNLITLNSIESTLNNAKSYKHKIEIVNQKIDHILQLQKAKELNMEPSSNDINLVLLSIAKTNNISINQLQSYPEFLSLRNEVSEKISILNLQRLITKDIVISENEVLNKCSIKSTDTAIKQIKVAQIIISSIETHDENNENNENNEIKLFLNNLSKHINKGASFDTFAKLHSQHTSYSNGGKTDWIEVNNPTVVMLDSLKRNEISEVYLTDFGFAIGIKLEERFVSINFKKCKEKLVYLNAEKFYSNWVKDLKQGIYIEIYHDKLY